VRASVGFVRDADPKPRGRLVAGPSNCSMSLFPCSARRFDRCRTDLCHYAVYRGDNEGFVPDESNRIGVPSDTFFLDEGFDPTI